MKILIVEDHSDSRLVLRKVLESAGHTVISAPHGADALARARKNAPDMIISDILMPVMDGYKLCHTIKQDPVLKHIPFIFYTATYVHQADMQLAMDMGASRYLVKPVDQNDFLRIIDDVASEMQQGDSQVSREPTRPREELFQQYDNSLSIKLNKKVRELEVYRNLYRMAHDAICVLSERGCVQHANPAFCELFNTMPSALQGRSVADQIGTESLDRVVAQIRERSTFHEIIHLEVGPGKFADLDVSAFPLLNERGMVLSLVLMLRDMTQYFADQASLKLFREMIDYSHDGIFLVDAGSGGFLDVNQRACERLGYPREELLTLHEWEVDPEVENLAIWKKRVADLKQQQAVIYEATHQARDGLRFPVDISMRYLSREGGDVIISVVRDISVRKAAEEKSRQAQLAWARTFDSTTEIITIQDLEHRVIQCNQAAADAFELTKEACLGRDCHELYYGAINHSQGQKPLDGTAVFEPYSVEVVNKKLGKIFVVNVSSILDEGRMTGIAHFARDVTAKRQLESRLVQAQRLESLATLAGGIAHDFNNILGAILGYAELAKSEISRDSRAGAALEQVMIGGQRAAGLVKQILSFSRKTEHQLSMVEVQKVIAEVLLLLRPSLPASIEIRLDVDQHCSPVFADPVKIHQLIMNICTNAYHAMRDQGTGTLDISLKEIELPPNSSAPAPNLEAGVYLELQIRDSGAGMTRQVLEKIFDPYFTTKPAGEGTGLGLAVAHAVVSDFGGQIVVTSTPGKSTSFKVFLPVADATQSTQPVSEPAAGQGGTERVLVVDDEESLVYLTKVMLGSYGYRVTGTTDSLEAIRLVRENPEAFDLVITDRTMPKMNGIALAKELLKIRPALPILLCTGYRDDNSNDEVKACGIRGILDKPFLATELAARVRRALDETSG